MVAKKKKKEINSRGYNQTIAIAPITKIMHFYLSNTNVPIKLKCDI